MEQWVEVAAGKMYVNNISVNQISEHLGVSRQYVSGVLRGKKKRKDAEAYIMKAIYEIIEERSAK